MSTESLEQRVGYPVIEALLSKVDTKPVIEEPLGEGEIRAAQNQGRDMVEHFTKFVVGDEIVFSRYFQVENEYHSNMHKGFWDQIRTNNPDMVSLEFPDLPTERQHVFGDLGVALREKVFVHDDNVQEYAVQYQAERLYDYPSKVLGTVATAHITQ